MRCAESLAALEELICTCRRGNVYDHLVLIATHCAQQVLRKPLRSGASVYGAIKASLWPFTLRKYL